jgi:hypothetical protein
MYTFEHVCMNLPSYRNSLTSLGLLTFGTVDTPQLCTILHTGRSELLLKPLAQA